MNLFKSFLLFMLLPAFVHAGDTTSVKQKRFAIGISASPDYCYRNLDVSLPSDATEIVSASRNANEIPMISFRAGINAEYRLTRVFGIEAGLSYSQQGFTTKPMDVTADCATPPVVKTTEVRRSNFHYITIPVKANFRFGKGKIQFIATAGIVPSYLLFEQSTSRYHSGNNDSKTYRGDPNFINNPWGLYANAGIGIDYHFGQRTGLKIQPDYSYGIIRTRSAQISEHLWNYGLNIGWYLRL
ncbi:MAG: porin family protein [Bacteroidia bacterium]|jgi:hypothetical protein